MASLHDERWNDHAREYLDFVTARGRHPRRPASDPLENSLSEWAHEQRRLYRGQRRQTLRTERQRQLEAIPGWEWNPRRGPTLRPDRWESQRRAVETFFAEHGSYPRLASPDAEERRLAGWVKNQVERLPGRDDEVGQQRLEAVLATPGWPQPRVVTWSSHVEELEAFVIENGRLPRRTPVRLSDDQADTSAERALSMWCANQRRFERASTPEKPYPPDRRARLDRIPGWTWAKPHARSQRRAAASRRSEVRRSA